jgi:hypothetical protein
MTAVFENKTQVKLNNWSVAIPGSEEQITGGEQNFPSASHSRSRLIIWLGGSRSRKIG